MDKDEIRIVLKERRKELGYTMKDVAALVGVSEATISRWESGDIVNMRRDRISKLAEALQISPAIIMGWNAGSSQIYEAAAGQGRINSDYTAEMFEGFTLKEGEQLATVVGDSMYPTLHDGDIVVVKRQNVLDRSGQIALVKINGDEATLKRIEKKSNGVVLIADNANVYPPHFFTDYEVGDLPVTVEGVVVRLIRDL